MKLQNVTAMSELEQHPASSVVAVYPDAPAAERAVRLLNQDGFALGDLSIVGRDLQTTEVPHGLVSRGDYVEAGAGAGALVGWLSGLCIGAGFLVLPELGLVMVAGPISAALLGAIEGGLAGTAVGGLAGALVGWRVPEHRALKYETQVKGGKFLVIVRSMPEVVDRARSLLAPRGAEHVEAYHPPAS
jgi:hypothetical protein